MVYPWIDSQGKCGEQSEVNLKLWLSDVDMDVSNRCMKGDSIYFGQQTRASEIVEFCQYIIRVRTATIQTGKMLWKPGILIFNVTYT